MDDKVIDVISCAFPDGQHIWVRADGPIDKYIKSWKDNISVGKSDLYEKFGCTAVFVQLRMLKSDYKKIATTFPWPDNNP